MNEDKLYGHQVDFLKLNDGFVTYVKDMLDNKYRIRIDKILIELYPSRQFVLYYKEDTMYIPMSETDEEYKIVNDSLKSIVRKLMEKYPEDFI